MAGFDGNGPDGPDIQQGKPRPESPGKSDAGSNHHLLRAVIIAVAGVVALLFVGTVMSSKPGTDPGTIQHYYPPSSPPLYNPWLVSPEQASDLKAFQQNCENGVTGWRTGQVDYPRTLQVALRESVTYKAAVDLRDTPLPPDKVIDDRSGEPAATPIAVRCRLAAKLIPVGEHIKVDGEADWVPRQVTPSGVVEWSWSVTADTPVDQQLRLVLVPATLVEGGNYAYGSDSEASLTTNVTVKSTLIDRISYWFDNQWPLLLGIAGALAVAGAASRKWIQEQIKGFKDSRKKKRGKEPAAT